MQINVMQYIQIITLIQEFKCPLGRLMNGDKLYNQKLNADDL